MAEPHPPSVRVHSGLETLQGTAGSPCSETEQTEGKGGTGVPRARLLSARWVQALLLPLTQLWGMPCDAGADVLLVVEAGGPASCSSLKAGVFGAVGVCLPTCIRAQGHQAEGTVTAAVLEERGLGVRACPAQRWLFSWRKVSVFLVLKFAIVISERMGWVIKLTFKGLQVS